MQDLINSMIKFSAAMTLFGLQQLQNMTELAVDSQTAMKRFRDGIDSVTGAVTSQLDGGKKPTVDSMSNLGADLVGRTWDAMNVPALDPREVLQTTGDLMRKTAESMTDWMKKTGDKSAGEPRPATDALR